MPSTVSLSQKSTLPPVVRVDFHLIVLTLAAPCCPSTRNQISRYQTCRYPHTNHAGPKIDITVFDALRRKFQCATVQLDFQFPIRFNLEYVTDDGSYQRPVIVHRRVGSEVSGGRDGSACAPVCVSSGWLPVLRALMGCLTGCQECPKCPADVGVGPCMLSSLVSPTHPPPPHHSPAALVAGPSWAALSACLPS